MYSYFIGRIDEIFTDHIVLENGGIGYEIFMPQREMDQMQVEDEVKVFTYLHVREDAMLLYGFGSKSSLTLFKMLIGVNGIGPKAALSILSILGPEDLQFAILSEDAKAISKAQGVGGKSAQRVIMELKDKISLMDAFEDKSNAVSQKGDQRIKAEAMAALESLGFAKSQILKALGALGDLSGDSVETIISKALKEL